MWHGLDIYGLIYFPVRVCTSTGLNPGIGSRRKIRTRPWARYVRRRCFGAWLTWMCLTTRLPVSRPLVSALASAFLRRPRRNSADLTGHLARETPNCFPTHPKTHQHCSLFPSQFICKISPCAARPVPPAYRLMGTASL